MTQRLLIHGGHVVPGGDSPELPRADVLVEGGAIAAVGHDLPVDGAETIDASGLVVMPGLVDSHRHVWQAPLRGIAADLTLADYFRVVLQQALPRYRPADARLATLLGAAEALDAGITTVFDWSNAALSPAHTEAIADAFSASGIRAVVGLGDRADTADVRRLGGGHGRVTAALAVLGFEYGDWIDTVRHVEFAHDLGLTVSMHVGGGPDSPIQRAFDGGLLGPDVHLVHLNQVTDDQAKLLADAGAGVTVTPVVEATMGHGVSAYGRLRESGIRPGLGTDVVVNAPADLFEPMRDSLRSERRRTATMWPASAILPAATVDSARAIGLASRIGTLAVGKRADVILVDGLAHRAGSASSAAGAVVSALGPANVRTVLVDGHVVKRDGVLVHHDLGELRLAGVELARRVLGTPERPDSE